MQYAWPFFCLNFKSTIMVYLLVLLLILCAVIAWTAYSRSQNRTKKLQSVIDKWGKPLGSERNFKLIAPYFNYCNTGNNILTDAIVEDLDLEDLFAYIDRTNSKPGQQYLYQKLRMPEGSTKELLELDELSSRFEADERLRRLVELELLALSGKNAYYLQELFTTQYRALYNGFLRVYIKLAALLNLAALILTVVLHNQYFFFLTLAFTLFNLYLHYGNKRKISGYVHSLPQLHALINISKKLYTLVPGSTADVNGSLNSLAKLNKSLSMISFQERAAADPNDLAFAFTELLKIFFLIEPAMFLLSVDQLNERRQDIERLYVYVGGVDMAISVVSLRTSLPFYSKPEFISSGEMKMADLYHPLIPGCVANSLTVTATQGTLITGSNMSGKTTFIRAVAINAIMAQTLFTSCTKSYSAPFVQILTSIRLSDDLEEHKSYFQSEAISMLNILRKSESPMPSLIIIDEIFRGTNTIERVAAAKAILSFLTASRNFTFVSTHDLELAELLGNEYATYSFEEKIAESHSGDHLGERLGERLVFDYLIKPGILKNKNGIAILQALGYPKAVVDEALATSRVLNKKYNLNTSD